MQTGQNDGGIGQDGAVRAKVREGAPVRAEEEGGRREKVVDVNVGKGGVL